MKDLKLSTWDRVTLLRCVPPTAPTIEEVAKHLRVAKILELTDEEKILVGWKETRMVSPLGVPGTSTTWNEEMAGYLFEVSLEDADFMHLQNLMTQFKDKPVSPLTMALHDKLEEAKKAKIEEAEKQDET